MIDSEYYGEIHGPELTKAILHNVSIIDNVREKYGQNNNWQGKLYTYKDIFGENSKGKKIYFEFQDTHGTKYWFHGFVNDLSQYFHPPLPKQMI